MTSITLPTASTFTWIGSEAFADTNMTTLNIPASVTTINPSAFFNCANLAYLYFSSGSVLTTIDEYAFANCGLLTQCRLPASLVTIGAAAFQGDYSIVRMVLPKNLTTIGAGAFIDCTQMNLTYFPHKVTTVGAYAFKGCYNTQAYFSDSDASGQTAFATNWDYVGASYTLNSGSALLKKNYNKPNLNYNSDYIYIQADPSITASNYDVNIIAYVGTDNSATAGSVNLDASGRGVVPATIVDVDDSTIQHKVIGINSYAFQNHTELGNVVFGSSSAPSNIKTISAYAFQGCDNLKVLDFNYASSLETIGAHAFEHSSTTSNITVSSLYIPASVTDIGAYAFTDFTKLTSLVFQDEASTTLYSHLTSIGDHAFLNAGSASYTANSPATFTLTLPCNYLANIWNNAFENARFISDLVFSSTKTNSALADSAVASLYIRSSAFYNCYSLANVTFSSHVVSATDYSFAMNKFDPTYILLAHNNSTVTQAYIGELYTNLVLKMSATLTYSTPVDYSLYLERNTSYVASVDTNGVQHYGISNYLNFVGLDSTTFAGLTTDKTADNDIIYYKTRNYALAATGTTFPTTSPYAINLLTTSITERPVGSTSVTVTVYLNVDFDATLTAPFFTAAKLGDDFILDMDYTLAWKAVEAS